MSIAQVLPFLAALKRQSPDFSGMTADPSADPVDMSAQASAPQQAPTNPQQLPSPMGPPEDPQQQGPQPDMSLGAQQPPADLSAAPTGKEAQPKLSKGTLLLGLLRNGLVGGLEGYANNAQTYAQTGRNAGFGGGFYGATQLPFLQAYQRGQLGQQQAQTELLRQQAQEINVPGYGSMPAGLAKVLFPSLIKGQTATAVQTMKGNTAEAVANINKRYMAVPGVGLFDTQNKQLLPGSEQGVTITPEIAQDYGLPQDFIGKPMNVSQLASLERGAAALAPTVKSTTDPLGLTTTSRTTKVTPLANRGGVNTPAGTVTPAPAGGGGAPANTGGAGGGSNGMSQIMQTAIGLVEGTRDPTKLPRGAAASTAIANAADAYSQQKYGKPFDLAQANTDFKYANEPNTQNTLKYLNSLTGGKGGKGNLDTLISLSDNIDRTQLPALNDAAAWARLQAGDPKIASYRAAVTEVADQVAKILQGGGSGGGTSDAKLQQAAGLFATGFNKDQMKGVASTLRDLLGNRQRELIGGNRYLLKQFGNQGQAGAPTANDLLNKYPPPKTP